MIPSENKSLLLYLLEVDLCFIVVAAVVTNVPFGSKSTSVRKSSSGGSSHLALVGSDRLFGLVAGWRAFTIDVFIYRGTLLRNSVLMLTCNPHSPTPPTGLSFSLLQSS
jgi:hypothetical protein